MTTAPSNSIGVRARRMWRRLFSTHRRPNIVIVACDPARGRRIEPAFRSLGATSVVGPAAAERLFERRRPDLIVVELGALGHDQDTAWHLRRSLLVLQPTRPFTVAVTDLVGSTATERAARVDAQAIVHTDDAHLLSNFAADQLPA